MRSFKWFENVVAIENLIESRGMGEALDCFLQALKNIEKDRLFNDPRFKNTRNYRDMQYQKQVLSFAVKAIKDAKNEGEAA